jgi:pSer/pThr/pTyr-binding forkhead associated (FHA) protein
MSITHPRPVGPFTLDPEVGATDRVPLSDLTELDATALLGQSTRAKAIAPELALRGPHLAFGDGDRTLLLRLDQDITHLGRGPNAHIRLHDHRVSRDHAILVRHGRYFRLLDNRSVNGIFVNGRRIVATTLSPGDVIELGPARLRFVEID